MGIFAAGAYYGAVAPHPGPAHGGSLESMRHNTRKYCSLYNNGSALAACKTLASAGWLAAAVRCAVARSAAFRVQAWLVRGVHCDCWLSTIAAARSCALRRVVLLVLKGI